MDWSNEVTLKFLRLYSQEPVIWNPRDSQHKNRIAANEAWQRIQQALGAQHSIKDLKRKKESLMATFRPIHRKVKASMELFGGTDGIYRPNWFAYDIMAKFLTGIYQPKPTTEESEDATVDGEWMTPSEEQETEDIVSDSNEEDNETEIRPESIFVSPPERCDRKRKSSNIEIGTEYPYKVVKDICESPEKDECSLFAQLLARKLRTFDETTRDILMHEIDNLIFRARMQQRNKEIPSSFHHFNNPYYQQPPFVSTPSTSYSQPSISPHSQLSPGNVSISQPTHLGNEISTETDFENATLEIKCFDNFPLPHK